MTNYDAQFIAIAEIIASMSKCVSYQVGCLFVKDGRILSTGYNGTPTGSNNCNQVFPNYNAGSDREKHREFSSMYEIHAELNTIIYAAKNGINVTGCSIYCTTEPCKDCAKSLIQLKPSKIIFLNKYDGNDAIRNSMLKFYRLSGVSIGQFLKSENKVDWF